MAIWNNQAAAMQFIGGVHAANIFMGGDLVFSPPAPTIDLFMARVTGISWRILHHRLPFSPVG